MRKNITTDAFRHTLLYMFGLLVLWASLAGCDKANRQETTTSERKDSTQTFAATTVRHAKGFTLSYQDGYKVLSIINPFENTPDTTTYILIPRGQSVPAALAGKTVIEIPIRTLVATSSMHIGLLTFLDAEDVLSGLASTQYVFSPDVIKMIGKGKIQEVGTPQGLNEEKVVALNPDLVMTSGSPSAQTAQHALLGQASIPVISNSEWVETTPLARTEWVKVLAALLDKEALANEKFDKIEKAYQELAARAAGIPSKPVAFSGLNTGDVWYLPNGDSYMARFIGDAGGSYPWKTADRSGSLPLSFEAVYPIALKADVWLNIGFDAKDTKATILTQDKRYGDFSAFKTGRMYSYNNRVNERGSNDFFETGNVEPHLVLSDLIRIFHPDLLPDHQLIYYKKLP